MLDVSCDYCGKPLTEPGALMFSPPDPRTRQCMKIHVCAPCWYSVEGWAEKVGSGAAEASEPSPPPTAPPLLEWGPDGPRLSEYERKRLERDEASGGVCGTCRGVDVGMAHWTCPACNGTGRKEGHHA